MKPWPRKLAQAHLLTLAARHDVEIVWRLLSEHDNMEASIAARTVWVPRPYNFRMYLIALHEFGHILSPLAVKLHYANTTGTADLQGYLACEGAAWGWAAENIDPDLAPWMGKRGAAGHGWAGYASIGFAMSRGLYEAWRERD